MTRKGSRERVLARVRAALTDVREDDPTIDVPNPWAYGQPTQMADVIERFVQRVEDYQAVVARCDAADIGAEIARALHETGSGTVVVPAGLDQRWLAQTAVDVRRDDPPLTANELDATDAVITAAAVGLAEPGTIVLNHGPDQGRRALSLVPDVHICVVRADQIVSDVPEALERLRGSVLAGAPLTWIAGPSATSDIELNRVEGVHGPRTLWVILAK